MYNLARNAYLLSDYFKIVTHKTEKIAFSKQAEQQLRRMYGATRDQTNTIASSKNISAVVLHKLAGTYDEVMAKLTRELNAL